MCGIAGIVPLRQTSQPLPESLNRMCGRLIHRGPDESGTLTDSRVLLGHQRLKIIDLFSGQQPMTTPDGRISIVFNGELYNFLEIRKELEAKGEQFQTRSDTESLLRLYASEGPACLGRLEGMFALAIYDRDRNKLVLAVDRFGKKPLYYTIQNGVFIFASELRAVMASGLFTPEIDEQSLTQYLFFEYVPAPRTMVRSVHKLEASHALELDLESHETKLFVYSSPRAVECVRTPAQWRELLLERFEDAVRKRLVSDVPLGVFLSGGLDSSSVLAMVKRVAPGRRIKTFSIGFDEPSFDESRHARRVSEYFGTEHVEHVFSMDQMASEHAAILDAMDEPLADASFLPTYLLCRMTKKHVTVALSGDGGDEVFYGYPTFAAHGIARALEKIPQGVVRSMRWAAQRLPTSMNNLSWDFKAKQFLKGMSYRGYARDQVWLGAFAPEDLGVLGERLRAARSAASEPLEVFRPAQNGLKGLRDFYFRFYLQGDILVKVDRAGMANALEVRSPLLDDRLVDAMRGVPDALLLRGMEGKLLLKQAMKPYLPPAVLRRAKKGFGIPIAHWIRRGLRADFEQALHPDALRPDGLFDADCVSRLLREHLDGVRDNRKKLWTLYVFQRWKRRWMDGTS